MKMREKRQKHTNGFKKAIYWSKEKMKAHAIKYSQGYAADIKKGTKWTFWSKDFDGMAYKTMLRQIISKWGIMSIDMQRAIDSDMAVINEDGTRTYVDNEPVEQQEYEEVSVSEENQEIVQEQTQSSNVTVETPTDNTTTNNIEEKDVQSAFFNF